MVVETREGTQQATKNQMRQRMSERMLEQAPPAQEQQIPEKAGGLSVVLLAV
jgi:hypothetical protein